MFFFEFISEIIDDPFVEILTTEEGIAVGRFYLEDTIANFEHGNVERAAAKIIDGNCAGGLFVETIGKRGRGRFVDDPHDFKARYPPGILGRLALRIIEVGRDRNDGLGDVFTEMRLGGFLHLH